METELYQKAIELYRQFEFEKAYNMLNQSGSVLNNEEQHLADLCKKKFTEQYAYIITNCISNKKYIQAKKKQKYYLDQYGEDSTISNIKIPINAMTMLSDNYVIIILVAIAPILLAISYLTSVKKYNEGELYDQYTSCSVSDYEQEVPQTEKELEPYSDYSNEEEPSFEAASVTKFSMYNKFLFCMGDLSESPISLKIFIDRTGNIKGTYCNLRYNTYQSIKGKLDREEIQMNFFLNDRGKNLNFHLKYDNDYSVTGTVIGESDFNVNLKALEFKEYSDSHDYGKTLLYPEICKGVIGGKYPVTLEMNGYQTNHLEGIEYYDKRGPSNILLISGYFENNNVKIFEYNEKGERTGIYEGIESNNRIEGNFTNYKGDVMDFYLEKEEY